MKAILVVGKYPMDGKASDGYLQRILAIDYLLDKMGFKRVYLDIGFQRNFLFKHATLSTGLEIFKLNFFLHRRTIQSLLNAYPTIYLHSIYNYVKVRDYLNDEKKVILDVHGVVPEENLYMGKFVRGKFFSHVEKEFFRHKGWVKIFVSEKMREFYKKKYGPQACEQSFVFPNFSVSVLKLSHEHLPDFRMHSHDHKTTLTELGFSTEDVILTYSGGIQPWQKVDEMVKFFSSLNGKQYKLLILTHEVDHFSKLLKKFGIPDAKFRILTVPHSELYKFYKISNYGFLLREQNIVNEVACPTKLLEYLAFGVIPIVKSSKIGDLERWNVDYVILSDNVELSPKKSYRNAEFIEQMLHEYNSKYFHEQLENSVH